MLVVDEMMSCNYVNPKEKEQIQALITAGDYPGIEKKSNILAFMRFLLFLSSF